MNKEEKQVRPTYIRLLDDPPGLAEDGGGDEDLLADHGVVLVVGVVSVAELAVGAEFELDLGCNWIWGVWAAVNSRVDAPICKY
jgi:hypothetical protein